MKHTRIVPAIIFQVIALLLLGGILTAQTESPLTEATLGLYGADSDNITSTTGWQNVFFDKIFVTGSYGYEQKQNSSDGAGSILNVNVLNTAALFNAGKLKIGAAYTGSLGNDLNVKNTQDGTGTIRQNTLPFFHNVRLLFGLPATGVGVRVGMDIGGSYNSTTITPATQNSSNANSLSFKPSIAAGTSFRTARRYTFSPSGEISLSVTNGSGTAAAAVTSGSVGPGIGSDGKTYENTRVYRAYTPAAEIALGIAYPSRSGIVSWSSVFKYGFSMLIMPEKYERLVLGGVQTQAVYRPDEAFTHALQADVTARTVVSWRLSVRANASVKLNYAQNLSGGSRINTIVGRESLQTTDARRFTVTPQLSAAAVYTITDTVSWFGGVGFRPTGYALTYEHSYDEQIAVASDKTTTVHSVKKPMLTHLGTGLQFTPSPQLSVYCAFVLKPDESAPVRTVTDAFNGNIRLGISWKDLPKN